ncbi:hypothetical protein LTR36_000765 [Oleoguttula mirabilis]|uniref:Uncharacterized protein n=1 Tax=Oleoguttula mirabilis TaxID=1507867 RepID=A0AAV9J379_9PEZI|nr:hypothetical protein LTR36_000765 [Oleoguttula mirabilis]
MLVESLRWLHGEMQRKAAARENEIECRELVDRIETHYALQIAPHVHPQMRVFFRLADKTYLPDLLESLGGPDNESTSSYHRKLPQSVIDTIAVPVSIPSSKPLAEESAPEHCQLSHYPPADAMAPVFPPGENFDLALAQTFQQTREGAGVPLRDIFFIFEAYGPLPREDS